MDMQHQELSFDIFIDQNNTKLYFTKDSNSEQIISKKEKDNKLFHISRDSIEREYYLIYDIPENPTKRLLDIMDDVNVDQLSLINRITEFRAYVQDQLQMAQAAKDPVKLEALQKEKQKMTQAEKKPDK